MWILIFLFFVILNIVSFFIPKQLSKIEIYATCFFAFCYGIVTDIILDIHYQLYGYFEIGFDWGGLVATILYFPSISLLFLNFYPLEMGRSNKVFYVLVWSTFATIFEWISLQTQFFNYNGWQLWYSALLYPMIFWILIVNWKFVKKLLKLSRNRNFS